MKIENRRGNQMPKKKSIFRLMSTTTLTALLLTELSVAGPVFSEMIEDTSKSSEITLVENQEEDEQIDIEIGNDESESSEYDKNTPVVSTEENESSEQAFIPPASLIPEFGLEHTEEEPEVLATNAGILSNGNLDIHLSRDEMDIRRANLGSFPFGTGMGPGSSLLDISDETVLSQIDIFNQVEGNPGFIRAGALGGTVQPGNVNSMAINNLNTIPIWANGTGGVWNVVHSANYDWYVVQVDDIANPQQGTIISGPGQSNPGQFGVFAGAILGDGAAVGQTNQGNYTGLRVWDNPGQSLPAGDYMIFGYPNNQITPGSNQGGRIVFDFSIDTEDFDDLDNIVNGSVEIASPGVIRKTFDGTDSTSRDGGATPNGATDTEIITDAKISFTFENEEMATINFPVALDILERFKFPGVDVDEYDEMGYTASDSDFITNVTNALMNSTSLKQADADKIAQELWDKRQNLYTGEIIPMPINIGRGTLKKTFDNTATLNDLDFENHGSDIQKPTLLNGDALNATLSDIDRGDQTFKLQEFTDEALASFSLLDVRVGDVIVDKAAEVFGIEAAEWWVLYPTAANIDNYELMLDGIPEPDWGERPAAVFSPLADEDEHEVHLIDAADLFDVSIVKALGPELMFDSNKKQSATITSHSARMADMIALDLSGAHNQLWNQNGVITDLWGTEINVAGNTGIEYSLYDVNPSLTRATPVALSTNTTGNFTGLTANTTYYVVAHSLESHNFLTGPATQYQFTTGAENVSAPSESDSTDTEKNLPSTGEAASIFGGIGAAILAGVGALTLWRHRKSK